MQLGTYKLMVNVHAVFCISGMLMLDTSHKQGWAVFQIHVFKIRI